MRKRLKILMMITRAELGGGQTHVVDLLRGMRDDLDVELATGETGYLTDAAAELGIPTHILPHLVQPMSPVQDAKALRESIQLMKAIRPDLVHAHTSKAGIIGRTAAKIAGVPSVFTAHTWCFAEATSLKWKLIGTPIERVAGHWCGKIINVSDANRGLALRKGVASAGKHVTIHNGIADTRHRARPGVNVVPRIVMLARFAPQKAQDLLVEALKGINVPFELLFVGDGPTRAAVEQQVAAAGLSEKIRFLGQRRDVPELMASAQVFALFTHWEGFPISILEAMRAGLPVVASDVGGVREAIDESCGRVIAPRDVASFRDALTSLVQSPVLRRQLGDAARKRYETEYTVEGMLERTLTVYRSVLNGTSGSLKLVQTSPSAGTQSY